MEIGFQSHYGVLFSQFFLLLIVFIDFESKNGTGESVQSDFEAFLENFADKKVIILYVFVGIYHIEQLGDNAGVLIIREVLEHVLKVDSPDDGPVVEVDTHDGYLSFRESRKCKYMGVDRGRVEL